MDAVAHEEAIKFFLENNLLHESNVGLSSRLAVTIGLLEKYHNMLSATDAYRLWFAHAQIRNRIILINPKDDHQYKVIDDLDENVGLAYRFGQRYISEGNDDLSEKLQACGVNNLNLNDRWIDCVNDDGISFDCKYKKGDRINIESIRRVFKSEYKIVIYD